jgi:hypothetical protein
MRIIGSIKNGIKRIWVYREPSDVQELAEIQNALICRLAAASDEAGERILKAVKEIDRILN